MGVGCPPRVPQVAIPTYSISWPNSKISNGMEYSSANIRLVPDSLLLLGSVPMSAWALGSQHNIMGLHY